MTLCSANCRAGAQGLLLPSNARRVTIGCSTRTATVCSAGVAGLHIGQVQQLPRAQSQQQSWHDHESRCRPQALDSAISSSCTSSRSRSSSRHARCPPIKALPDLAAVASSPYRDTGCFVVALIGAAVLVKFFNTLALEGYVEKKLSRKLVHTLTGPLFVVTWPLFSMDPSARFLAAAVPILNVARMWLVGSGVIQDKGLVSSVSRSGESSELLKGPLYYCFVLILVTMLCWRDTPAGLITISIMCGGDGLADIIGRRFGTVKLPFNQSKSWAGSAAMCLGSVGMALGLVNFYCYLGFFSCYTLDSLLPYVFAVSLAATVVEALPINEFIDDNISVPAVSLALSWALMESLKVV